MNNFTKHLLLILALFLTSCSSEEQKDAMVTKTTNKIFKVDSPYGELYRERDLNVIIIDDCEYLYGYVGGNGGYVLCHKGNCNNPAHIYNKSLMEKSDD